jgi:hypothetical protein
MDFITQIFKLYVYYNKEMKINKYRYSLQYNIIFVGTHWKRYICLCLGVTGFVFTSLVSAKLLWFTLKLLHCARKEDHQMVPPMYWCDAGTVI